MSERILIIDDEVDMLFLLRTIIEDNTDYKVETINSPLEGIELIKEKDFDLVITDLKMPVMDGIDLVAKCQDMGCDVSIVCDDGTLYWSDLQCAADNGHPVIRVNHGTSEEPGMVTLTKYIRDVFPVLHVEHLPHGSSYRLAGDWPPPRNRHPAVGPADG